MIKLANLIVCIVSVCIAAQTQYKPLSKSDKKHFVSAVKAIEMASNDKNFDGVKRFGDGILKQYESVLLDPSCVELRPLYVKTEQIVIKAKLVGSIDTLEQSIINAMHHDDYTTALSSYDKLFDYLYQIKDDSLISLHKEYFSYCLRQFFSKTSNLQSLEIVTSLRNADQVFIDSLRKNLEQLYKELFVQIASSNNIAELINFKKQYPGLYENDLNNLIENYRAKWRLAIKRSPTLNEIERYHSYFPDQDKSIDIIHQKLLYNDFIRNMGRETAMKYLTNFPDGKYSNEIRTFLDVQKQQQRILSDGYSY